MSRFKSFKQYLRRAFDELGKADDMVEISIITDKVQQLAGALIFGELELEAAFEKLTADNAAMITDNLIMLI